MSATEIGVPRATQRGFAAFAWAVLGYNVLVILWGAYVRATGSGAGCGSHWPLCNGEVVPRAPQVATVIEFAHRASSGIALLLVAAMLVWAWRAFPRRHPARLGAALSAAFIVTEALLGAALVLFEWVARNASAARAISLSLHLINTLMLLASLALAAWWGSGRPPVKLRGPLRGITIAALAGVVVLGVTGAIAALGDTLFPARSLALGLEQDLSSTAHLLIRLRTLHPVMALVSGALALVAAVMILNASQAARALATFTIVIVLAQMAAGLMNLLLLAPVWMQIVHLLLADLLWIALVLTCAAAMPAPDARPLRASL